MLLKPLPNEGVNALGRLGGSIVAQMAAPGSQHGANLWMGKQHWPWQLLYANEGVIASVYHEEGYGKSLEVCAIGRRTDSSTLEDEERQGRRQGTPGAVLAAVPGCEAA